MPDIPDWVAIHEVKIRQGYLMLSRGKNLRVRIVSKEFSPLVECNLCYKVMKSHVNRLEFEYPIPQEEAEILMDSTDVKLTKTRISAEIDGYHMDFDTYEDGLQVVEIEFEDELTEIPEFCGKEITGNEQLSNIGIALKMS